MATHVLQINPDFPVVWQNPSTLQIGIDPPVVVLPHVHDDLLLLLHHLCAGVSDTGLAMFARLQGVSAERTQALLEALAPALGSVSRIQPQPFVLDGPEDLLGPASRVLRDLGHTVFLASTADHEVGEVLIFGHFVPHPRSFHRLLRIDRPHTPVIFSDQAVTVGPRIAPGRTPCLKCALARDGHSPRIQSALSSQLWGRVAPSASPEAIRLGTWHAQQLVAEKSTGRQVRISRGNAVTEGLEISRALGCGCLGLIEH